GPARSESVEEQRQVLPTLLAPEVQEVVTIEAVARAKRHRIGRRSLDGIEPQTDDRGIARDTEQASRQRAFGSAVEHRPAYAAKQMIDDLQIGEGLVVQARN